MATLTFETHGKSTSVRLEDGRLIGYIHAEAAYASVVITPMVGETFYRVVHSYEAAVDLFERLTENEAHIETYTGDAVTGGLHWDAWTERDVASIFVSNAGTVDQQYEIALTLRATYDELVRIEAMLSFTIARLAVTR